MNQYDKKIANKMLKKFKHWGHCIEDEEVDVIVSLTSYPPRFPNLHKVIGCLLRQSLKPARICLWIAEDDFVLLPSKVQNLTRFGLEILTVPDFKSYSKIIHCYQENPDAVIVTCDDDQMYPRDWLKLLYKHHLMTPSSVICHRARYIAFNERGNLMPYHLWPNVEREIESLGVFPVGAGGVLYPPGCFYKDVDRDDIFLNICDNGDDIWLKTMTLLNINPCID